MIGQCRLCLARDVKLLNSHLMPAALYKIIRDERFTVAHPVHHQRCNRALPSAGFGLFVVSRLRTPFQQGGETWVIRRCWQNTKTFPLRAALVNAQPNPRMEAGVAIYEGAGIPDVDVDRLGVFRNERFLASGRPPVVDQQGSSPPVEVRRVQRNDCNSTPRRAISARRCAGRVHRGRHGRNEKRSYDCAATIRSAA